MVPKSGYRFSEKTMRPTAKKRVFAALTPRRGPPISLAGGGEVFAA
jgi:hypothetical protein